MTDVEYQALLWEDEDINSDICEECGADWNEEGCDPGCSNYADHESGAEVAA